MVKAVWILTFMIGIVISFSGFGFSTQVPDTIKVAKIDTLAKVITPKDSVSVVSKSKIKPGVPSKYDWIKLLDGAELEVEVRKISEKYVFYSQPGNMKTTEIDRRLVQTIYYRTGKVELMNKKATEIKTIKDWRHVKITKEPMDVEGMIKLDDIEIVYEASSRQQFNNASVLESGAEIRIRKEAGSLNADIVLIKKITHQRAYGEAPSVLVNAEAYRFR
jgi:hypothetical protein